MAALGLFVFLTAVVGTVLVAVVVGAEWVLTRVDRWWARRD